MGDTAVIPTPISTIAFLTVCICIITRLGNRSTYQFRRLNPGQPATQPATHAEPAAPPPWADLAIPLDRVETVDDILAQLGTQAPPPIIPGNTPWSDVIDRDPVDQHLIAAIARADATEPDPLAWTEDPTACDGEFIDLAEAHLEDLDELYTRIFAHHNQPPNIEETAQ
jgi:hypothetical protein